MEENSISPEKLYNSTGLAAAMGLTDRVVREKAKAGILPATKFEGKWYFLGKEVIEAIMNSKPKK